AGQLPVDGEVLVQDKPISSLSGESRARLIAYLPQQRLVGWPIKVADVVGLGRMPWAAWGSRASERDRTICREAMELMDIVHLADRPANALSGGEQARVLTAR